MKKQLLSIMTAVMIALSPITPVQAKKTITITMQIVGLKNKTMAKGKVVINKNKTVYDALYKFTKAKKLKLVKRGFFKSTYYITRIGNLKERQYGSKSGWIYKVGNKMPHVGAGSYKLTKNATVRWIYVNANT